MIDHGVEISAVPIREGSALATFLYSFGPALLIIGLYVWMYRRAAQGGGLAGGGVFGMARAARGATTWKQGRKSPSTT